MPLVRPPTVIPVRVKPVGTSPIQTDRNKYGAASGTVFSDSFTRADNAADLGVADTGQDWEAWTGTLGILSNKAYNPNLTEAVWHATGAADGTLTTDVTLSATNDRAHVGLVFRGIDANNFLFLVLAKISGFNTTILFKKDGGGFTTLIDNTAAGLTNGSTYAVSVVLSGANITCTVGGVLQFGGPYTLAGADATKFTSPTEIGLRILGGGASDDGGSRFDNLLLTAL